MTQRLVRFGLAAFAFAVFIPSLGGDFVLDDEYYVVRNPTVSQPSRWPRFFFDPSSLRPHPVLSSQGYRPLSGISFGLNQLLGGENPFWYHLVNSLLHSANTLLVFQLALTLIGSQRAAFAAALLFCLHPVQVEGVAYIGARPTLLATCFSLCSFLLYLSKVRSASWALFACALLSQEGAAFLPLAIALYDLGMPRTRWSSRAAQWAPFLSVLATFIIVRQSVLGRFSQRGWWGGDGWLRHLEFAAWGLGRDLRSLLWPSDLRICYGLPASAKLGGVPILVVGLLVLSSLLSWWLIRRRSVIGFGLGWFLVALVPVSNLIPIDALAADRFLYMAMVGASIVVAASCVRVRPQFIYAAALAGVLLFLPMCLEQQLAWQSLFSLELDAHAAGPTDPCPAAALARHYRFWGMRSRADAILRSASSQFTN